MNNGTAAQGQAPFYVRVAKSIFDYALKRNIVLTNHDDGILFFYAMATKNQSEYTAGKSGEFIDNDGRLVIFKPYGGRSISSYIYPEETKQERKSYEHNRST